jgi:hypothetical protein
VENKMADQLSSDEISLEEAIQKRESRRSAINLEIPDPMSLLPSEPVERVSIDIQDDTGNQFTTQLKSSNPMPSSGRRQRRDSKSVVGEDDVDLISISEDSDSMEMELRDVAINTSDQFFTSLSLSPFWNSVLQWVLD